MSRFCLLAMLALGVTSTALAQDRSVLAWPSTTARVAGWQADLDSALTVFLPRDRSFDAAARARFTRDVRALRDSVARLSDEQLIVRLAGAVAGAHNAHTRLYLLRNRTVLRRYPIRVWWFKNQLIVVRAHSEQADLLGASILSIAGRPASEVEAAAAGLYTANASWRRYLDAYLLTSPEVLKGIGVTTSDTVQLTVRMRNGRVRNVTLLPLPLARSQQPVEAWWDLAPTHDSPQGPWSSLLSTDTTQLPLYLRHLDRFYWTNQVEPGVLYIQYNRAEDQPGSEAVRAFGDRLLQEIKTQPPAKLIIDLRFNTGGNLELADSFFRGVAALPLAQERGRLFVITGRATFSAGITPVALLRQLTRVTIVGEPVGDVLDFWAEGGNVVLPNTELTLHYANGFHSYSPREYPAFRPYNYDLSVTEVGPDIRVEPSIAQYLAGRDVALDAIMKFTPTHRQK